MLCQWGITEWRALLSLTMPNSFYFIVVFIIITLLASCQEALDTKIYIVYMGEIPKANMSISSVLHVNLLKEVVGSERAEHVHLHSYKRSFNGFVAKLTTQEMLKVAGMDGVVSVFENKILKLHTTGSWDFLGFSPTVQRSRAENDVIVGMFDTGVWPESESFRDEGIGPPPSKWKGMCQTAANFSCNNKLIGARYYLFEGEIGKTGFGSPRDSDGHGTHTASIAAGSVVNGASLLGLASGSARGAVPSARIAVYKICWGKDCPNHNILAAFDDAIADGVDIISISVGGAHAHGNYFEDPIAIGSFHAMRNGILTVSSAGNSGPDLKKVGNVSPWALSVAASTIDRRFVTDVMQGDGRKFEGASRNTFDLNGTNYELVNSDCTSDKPLDENLVKEKIVLCETMDRYTGKNMLEAGAVGTIFENNLPRDGTKAYPLPSSGLTTYDKSNVEQYINSTSHPTGTISKTITQQDGAAAHVPYFSSRGPNAITLNILKLDLAAPGVDILGAWPTTTPLTNAPHDSRRVPFNLLSGTSMACPHVSSAAAYIKSFHPTWSPSAIMSALMTTATPMASEMNPEAELAYGAGQLNPLLSVNPGLVYESFPTDFVRFLCGQGYNSTSLERVTGDNSTCQSSISVWNLNLPSFVISSPRNTSFLELFRRNVTNVGIAKSMYKLSVTAPPGVTIDVEPKNLSFTTLGQQLRFQVSVAGTAVQDVASGSLMWSDGVHRVRSAIVVLSFL